MNIGILYGQNVKKRTGISNVFCGTMEQILKQDTKNQYYSICDNYYHLPMIEKKIITNSTESSSYYDYFCYMNNINILHSYWDAFYNIQSKCYKVLTFYDLIPIVNKEWHPGLYNYFNKELRKSAKEADKIIAISEYTKKDLIEYYGINPDKIKVIYLGNNQKPKNMDLAILEDAYHVEGDYLLGVSSLVNYKNFNRMIETFLIFKEKYKDSNLKLVIVGKMAWDDSGDNKGDLYKKYAKDIIYTGYIEDDILNNLYRNALAFIYISLYEGFGLPILEAMSMGKAVISSNTTSMPEVGGDAVEYCNPYECESILTAIEKIVFNETYRVRLEQKAFVQAKKFSYQNTAREILEIYKNAY